MTREELHDLKLGFQLSETTLRIADSLEQAWVEIDMLKAKLVEVHSPINIIFDGPPSHEAGRFVEVEADDGRSINVGEWSERPGGYWALRIIR